MIKIAKYHASDKERFRSEDLLSLVPRGLSTVLDVGAFDGHFSRLLTKYFDQVTALDLQKPEFEFPGVRTVAGDATNLQFPDRSFDCVFCTEVLEHVPDLEKACRELVRVAKHVVVVGVPFQQDIRVGRTTCRSCGAINPPWGHVNTFDEKRLNRLFPDLYPYRRSFVGARTEATNPISALLMDWGGNPWGTYNQIAPCPCGAKLEPPANRGIAARICSGIAGRINVLQSWWTRPRPGWIHLVLSKREAPDIPYQS